MGLGAKDERFTPVKLVVLYRHVPRYRGQDILLVLYLYTRFVSGNEGSIRALYDAGNLNEGGITKASRFSSLCG